MPHGSHLERFATLLVFVLTIGRCMFLGIFSSSMKQSLYQSGLKLKEAYKRIEELAELDELTGSYQPPLHHADAGRGDRPRRRATDRPARSR